jgi:enoyl-CoA hydratase
MAVHYAKLAASRGGEIDFHSGYMLDIAAYNVLVSSADQAGGREGLQRKAPAALERTLTCSKKS